MKHLILISSLLIFVQSAQALNSTIFHAKVRNDWQPVVRERDEVEILRKDHSKTKQTIILQSSLLTSETAQFQNALPSKRAELQEIRAEFFRKVGLSGYQLLDVVNRKSNLDHLPTMQVIRASFINFAGRDVQAIERQYLVKNRLFTITYTEETPMLNDLSVAENFLNQFTPNVNRARVPASENDVELESLDDIVVLQKHENYQELICTDSRFPASELINSFNNNVSEKAESPLPALAATKDFDMSKPDNQRRCSEVPEEKRRKSTDILFSESWTAQLSLKNGWGCVLGAKDNIWGMIKGAASSVFAVAKFANPFSSAYRDQVKATVGVVGSEIWKDPKEFTKRVGSGVYNAIAKELGDYYYCLNPQEQVRAVCNVATNLLPFGLLAKVVTKAPMLAEDVAALSKVIKESVQIDRKGLNVVAGAESRAASESDAGNLIIAAVETRGTEPQALAASKSLKESSSRHSVLNQSATNSVESETAFPKLDTLRLKLIETNYGDILRNVGKDRAEINALIANLEARNISRVRIRQVILKSKQSCSTL